MKAEIKMDMRLNVKKYLISLKEIESFLTSSIHVKGESGSASGPGQGRAGMAQQMDIH